MGPDGLTTFMNLPEGQQILVVAHLMYGYGYVGPFALEYEKTALDCDLFDYEQVCYQFKPTFIIYFFIWGTLLIIKGLNLQHLLVSILKESCMRTCLFKIEMVI